MRGVRDPVMIRNSEVELKRGVQRNGENFSSQVLVYDKGLEPYPVTYQHQLDLVRAKKHRVLTDDILILVEHPDVYTYGRKSRGVSGVAGFPSFAIERGGDVTYHNPGQIVGYPILSLNPEERDLHRHLRRLEDWLIETLGHFGVLAERREGATGVWVSGKQKKIASIGVAVSSWVTYHGFALNVSNELQGFSRIHPCGFPAEVMTSLNCELGQKSPSLAEVKKALIRGFPKHFHRQIVLPDPLQVI